MAALPPEYGFTVEYEAADKSPTKTARFIIRSSRKAFRNVYLFENGALELYQLLAKALSDYTE